MMRPEGYRKSMRLMNLADRLNIPIITFIDTPGAYPEKEQKREDKLRPLLNVLSVVLM